MLWTCDEWYFVSEGRLLPRQINNFFGILDHNPGRPATEHNEEFGNFIY